MGFIWFLLIGLLAGFLAGKIMKGRGFGLLGNMAVGIVGAILGGFMFRIIGLQSTSLLASIVTATVGAVVLLFFIGVVSGRR